MDPNTPVDIDPFVLDFGSSVIVSEEMRKSIGSEIKEIDVEISSSQNEHKTEERCRMQYCKEFSHAHIEMSRMRRDVHEDLEQALVRKHLLQHARDTIESDIVSVLVTPTSSPTDANKLNVRDSNNMVDTESHSKTLHQHIDFDGNLSSCLDNYKVELRRLSEMIKKDKADCGEWMRKIEALEEEYALKQIQINKLSKHYEQVSEQAKDIRRENLSDEQNIISFKESIEKEKLLIRQYEEVFAHKSAEMSSLKSTHAYVENQHRLQKEDLMQLIESLNNERVAAMKVLETDVQQLQMNKDNVSKYEILVATDMSYKKELERVREALMEKTLIQYSEAKDFLTQAEKLKTANDLEEDALVCPAREETKEVDLQRKKLAQLCDEMDEKQKILEEENRKFDDESRTNLDTLNSEMDNNQAIIASRKAEQASVQRLLEDEKETFAQAVEAQLILIANVKISINDGQQKIDKVEESRRAVILERQIQKRSDIEKCLQQEKMKLEMYQRLVSILAETDGKIDATRDTIDLGKSSTKSSKRPRGLTFA